MGYRKVNEPTGTHLEPLPGRPGKTTAFSLARLVMAKWWSRQPVHETVAQARPLIQELGREHPVQLVACGAGTGAALVLLKPWKWLPLIGIAAMLARVVMR